MTPEPVLHMRRSQGLPTLLCDLPARKPCPPCVIPSLAHSRTSTLKRGSAELRNRCTCTHRVWRAHRHTHTHAHSLSLKKQLSQGSSSFVSHWCLVSELLSRAKPRTATVPCHKLERWRGKTLDIIYVQTPDRN